MEDSGSSIRARLKVVAVALALGVLAATNVLTLVDDQFHAKAYGWLDAVVRLFSDGSALRNSPTEVRKHDVAVATQALVKERDYLARHALELTSDAVAIAAEIRAIKIEKAALHAAATTWEQRHKQAEDMLQRNRSATQKLSKTVVQRLARNTSRNMSGLLGKAVPYLGIGVTLAMTGLDVVDACDTVREMNQLAKSMELPAEDETGVCGVPVPSKDAVIAEVSKNWKASYLAASEVINQAGQQIPPPPTTDVLLKQASSFLMGVTGPNLHFMQTM